MTPANDGQLIERHRQVEIQRGQETAPPGCLTLDWRCKRQLPRPSELVTSRVLPTRVARPVIDDAGAFVLTMPMRFHHCDRGGACLFLRRTVLDRHGPLWIAQRETLTEDLNPRSISN